MFVRIEKYLKDKIDEVVFIELKKDLKLKSKEFTLDKNIPLPIPLKEVVNKVKGDIDHSDISISKIVQGMIFIIGADSDFKYNEYYKKFLINLDENIIGYIINQGLEYAKKNKKMDALICFKAGLYIDKNDLNLLYNYARCCEDLAIEREKENFNEFEEEALEVFETIAERHPDFPLSYYHLGFYYANKNLYKKAELTWKTCLEKDIDENKELEIRQKLIEISDKIKYEEGYTLVLNGSPNEALEKLLTIEEKYPEWWNLLFFIGLAYRQLQSFEEALKYFKRVLKLMPNQIDTLNEIGLCYMALGKIDDAIKYFKKALNLKENDSEILCNLGIAYIQKMDYKAAEQYITKSYKLNPNDDITKAWVEKLNQLIKH
ncbi:MAG: hypothetical protein PWQ37_789 [Candidatus Petromonas sp.]|jgi:tetratricopeptide (TPR) repeat protein|nr:hypothetical protein [Candidatus Petromonas sp.]